MEVKKGANGGTTYDLSEVCPVSDSMWVMKRLSLTNVMSYFRLNARSMRKFYPQYKIGREAAWHQ
jgi:hypothetical protein